MMYRLRLALVAGFLAGFVTGCGEDQPNAPTPAAETNADFMKKSQDLMKSTSSGMDLKKAQSTPPPK